MAPGVHDLGGVPAEHGSSLEKLLHVLVLIRRATVASPGGFAVSMPRSIARPASTCAPEGGADETGQDRRGLGERVGRRRVVVGLETVRGQQPSPARAGGGEDPSHVLIARRGAG